MEYKFYGHEICNDIHPINKDYLKIDNPLCLFDYLKDIWCSYTCAPRMRIMWNKGNMTLGQCSITSFLVQDIFGGEVYGVPLKEGGYHCFNVVNNKIFDLTSEQFKGEVLTYTLDYPQAREEHFSSKEKYDRYLYLVKELQGKLR